jgi:RNA polymerase sigma factor (sigma-70 family)
MPGRKGIKNEVPYGTLVGVSTEVRSIWYAKNDEPEPCELIDAPVVDDDQEQIERDCKVLVDYLIDKITDLRTKQILMMRYWSDMTYREIGEVFGVSSNRIIQIEGKEMCRMRWRLNLIAHKI